MIPQIINLGPIPINSFGLMLALAFFAAIYRMSISFARNGIPPAFAERVVFWAAISGLIGARIFYVLQNPEILSADPLSAVVSSSGFVFFGGFIVASVTLTVLAIREKVSFAAFVDSMGPALTLAYAIGRVGCQLSGDGDYGIATTGFWGMSYVSGVVPTPPGLLVYPTPVFESVVCIGILWALSTAERAPSWQHPFSRFGLYLTLIAVERFLVEFIRVEPRYSLGFSQAQYISICLFVVGSLLLLRRRASHSIGSGRG